MFHSIVKMFHLIILSYIRFLRSEPVERCSQKSATHSTLRPCAIALGRSPKCERSEVDQAVSAMISPTHKQRRLA